MTAGVFFLPRHTAYRHALWNWKAGIHTNTDPQTTNKDGIPLYQIATTFKVLTSVAATKKKPTLRIPSPCVHGWPSCIKSVGLQAFY